MEKLTHAETSRIKEKWGDAIGTGGLTGFVAIPEVLLRGQKRLGLTSTEMMVLINILMHWWYPTAMPFPSNQKIAQRMGVTPKTVQRACSKLESKRLISREVKIDHDKKNNQYSSRRTIHLGELVSRLEEIARDLSLFAEQNKLGS